MFYYSPGLTFNRTGGGNMELVPQREVARLLGVKTKTLEKWRWVGEGPPYVKVNGHLVRYELDDVEAWLNSQRRPDHGGRGAAVSERAGSRIKTRERLEHG